MRIRYLIRLLHLSVLLLFCMLGLLAFQLFDAAKVELSSEQCGVIDAPYTESESSTPDEMLIGKQLFKMNCAQCHNRNMKDDLSGPALSDVEARWAEYPRQDLYDWIRNSQKMVYEKHPRALFIWEKWDRRVMNAFPTLKDEDIEAILAYIRSREG